MAHDDTPPPEHPDDPVRDAPPAADTEPSPADAVLEEMREACRRIRDAWRDLLR